MTDIQIKLRVYNFLSSCFSLPDRETQIESFLSTCNQDMRDQYESEIAVQIQAFENVKR